MSSRQNAKRTVVVTGGASGIGAATVARLRADGARALVVDVRDADVVADLGTPEGRREAIRRVGDLSGGVIDGLVTCAGLGPLPNRAPSLLTSVNYFGTVDLLTGLRPLLEAGTDPAAVAISSNSTTSQPNWPSAAIDAMLAGDEGAARDIADKGTWTEAYAITKVAVARWVRRHATAREWIGAGIRLNVISPGLIETPLTEEGRKDAQLGPLLAQFPIPLGRPGRPEEIAALIAFLLSAQAALFVGSNVFADGGTDALLRADDWPAVWKL